MLQQWPAIAPDLAPHVRAVGFDPEHGRLDLLPDSPAYATQLRMSTARLVALANQAAGREAVRSIRVLPPGPQTSGAPVPSEARPDAAQKPEGPVRTREEASAGDRQALAAHRVSKAEPSDRLAPAVRAAIERQSQALRQHREPELAFADTRVLTEQLQARARATADPRARALARVRAERAGLAVPAGRPAEQAQAG